MIAWFAFLLVMTGLVNCGPQYYQDTVETDQSWNIWNPAARFDDSNQGEEHVEGLGDASSSTPGTHMFNGEAASTTPHSFEGDMMHEDSGAADAAAMGNLDDISDMRAVEELEKKRTKWSHRMDEEERKLDDAMHMNHSMDMFSNDNHHKDLHEIWRHIVEVTHEIRQHKPISFNRQKMLAERRYEMKLRNDYARLRYKSKLRKCEWPDLTFYAPRKRCMMINSCSACPKNQMLYDGPRNEGICDCVQDERDLVYYSNDAQCHQLNVQGPCKDDEWLVLKSQGTPQCEVVPSGCLADGMHVFWPADGKCYKLGKKGPCTESNHVLQRNEHLDVSCMHSSVNTLIEKRPWGQLPRINPNMATIDLQRRASRFLCPPAGRMNQTGTGYCNHMMGH